MSYLKPVILSIFILFFIAGSAYSSQVRSQLAQESTLEQVMKRGVMRVGMSTFVPWAMQSKEGEFIGFEIDVATRLAQDMGVNVEFVPTRWSGIIPALLTGKFDIIIGGMGIRPDRNLKVNFSMPYDYSGMSIVAHKQKAKGFTSLDDFNSSDVTIAARLGTTAASAAGDFMPEASLRLFDDEAQAIQELMNGRVHAVVASAPLPAFQAIQHPDRLFVPIEENFTQEPIGFAVRKGDYDIINFLDNWIRFVQAEGWLKQRKHYWFETRDWADQIR
ncbi:transporter substrate-binding domain-containing protein [Desulfonatronovibrio magnus]|uniref:transporter substrate-binding domain-containing protein n=1 Tax=Desulfonatronovibrio magnus TaxID=698827 RepID=UPI0005EADA46|nr:transporter substrate-binding domain-containing protein [Desulfonatronovibrio magnus]